MKLILCAALVLCVSACSGNDKLSPTTPAPAAPQYPSLIGTWSGSLSVRAVATVGGVTSSLTNVCNESWRIDGQTAGHFTGSFANIPGGGSTATCDGNGTISGDVTTAGSLSNVSLLNIVGGSSCPRIAGSGLYVGTLAGSSSTLNALETVRCTTSVGAVDTTRTLTIFVTKQ